MISQAESASGNVPGMERAIPKSKGQEFGSLLHQLGAEFAANPFSPQLRDLLLSIAPDAKDRMPKRVSKKPAPAPEPVVSKKGSKEKPREPEKAKEKPAAAKKAAAPVKKAAEPARTVEHGKKKTLTTAKTKPAAKPLVKRKPR